MFCISTPEIIGASVGSSNLRSCNVTILLPLGTAKGKRNQFKFSELDFSAPQCQIPSTYCFPIRMIVNRPASVMTIHIIQIAQPDHLLE